jgi:hypothetical protein
LALYWPELGQLTWDIAYQADDGSAGKCAMAHPCKYSDGAERRLPLPSSHSPVGTSSPPAVTFLASLPSRPSTCLSLWDTESVAPGLKRRTDSSASGSSAVRPQLRLPFSTPVYTHNLISEDPGANPPTKWHAIANHVPNRTNKDCRKRWWAQMATTVAKGGWSADEDERLCNAVEEYGTK